MSVVPSPYDAVLFDFGGVVLASPFAAFEARDINAMPASRGGAPW